MKKGLIIGLVALLVLGLAAGMGSATVTQYTYINQVFANTTVTSYTAASDVTFINDVTLERGFLTVINEGDDASDVRFYNDLQMDTGRLTFEQTITTSYGSLANDIVLDAGKHNPFANLQIENMASEQFVPGHNEWITDPGYNQWVPNHREVSFLQEVYLGDTDRDKPFGFESFSRQRFDIPSVGYIKQKVLVREYPGIYIDQDRIDMWGGIPVGFQAGVLSNKMLSEVVGGQAQLVQVGEVHGDYAKIKQQSDILGPTTGKIVPDPGTWEEFEQIITYH